MAIKNAFNKLKKIGRKKYYYRNGAEEVHFVNKKFIIEIYYYRYKIDIVINNNGDRKNYANSELITIANKSNIKSILNSFQSVEAKCRNLSLILLDNFMMEESDENLQWPKCHLYKLHTLFK